MGYVAKKITFSVAALLLLAFAAVAYAGHGVGTGRHDIILAGTGPQVLYHAESAPTRPNGAAALIGRNIQIDSDRGQDGGLAGACDPDPRFGAHPRPDDEGCTWAVPAGNGEDEVQTGAHIQEDFPEQAGGQAIDTDFFPNGSPFGDPGATDTRESSNGRGGLDDNGNLFIEQRPMLDDEDLNFRLVSTGISAYLAPQGNANNRWRRMCGIGVIEALDDDRPPLAPFAAGDTRAFVVQIWDADWKDPSDQDGGNQDYFIIDILALGTTINLADCRALPPGTTVPPPPGPGPGPGPTPGQPGAPGPQFTPEGQPLVPGEPIVRGRAAARGPRRCVRRPFLVSVIGRQIRRVRFTIDGRRFRTVTRPDARGNFSVRIDPRRFSRGAHRVRAHTTFLRGAGASRTLRVTFQRCARATQRVAPRFTG